MATTNSIFEAALETYQSKLAELKEVKGRVKELVSDVPMELEDKLQVLKNLKKEVKDQQLEWDRQLLEENAEYGELRENVQELKEGIAQAKLELFTEASNLSREHGDLDQTVVVQGVPTRLQTQRELSLYVDGKVIK
jgi:DNA repair ATPase RecN